MFTAPASDGKATSAVTEQIIGAHLDADLLGHSPRQAARHLGAPDRLAPFRDLKRTPAPRGAGTLIEDVDPTCARDGTRTQRNRPESSSATDTFPHRPPYPPGLA